LIFCSHLKVSRIFKSDNEERIDTWDSTISAASSIANSVWTNKINTPLCIQKQFSSSNECFDHKKSNLSNPKKIIAPSTLILEKNRSNQLVTYNQNNFHNYNEYNNENYDKSLFEFKKPVTNKMTNILRSIGNVKDGNCKINKNYLPDLSKKNIYNNINKQTVDTSKLKLKLRPLVSSKTNEKIYSNRCWFFMCIILIPMASLYLSFFLSNEELLNKFCNPRLKFQNILEDLKNHIHGQDDAINNLTKYFKEKENQTGFNIIGLIGGTGVGKSYTAEIIKNNLKDIYNTKDFFQPFDDIEDIAYTSLSLCQCNLIRLENIKTKDILDSVNLINNLNKRANNYYCILILALFNTQETSYNLQKSFDIKKSLSEINNIFKKNELQYTMVSFITLNNEALIKCIKEAADYANMELSNDDIEYVKKDLLRADNGCKGAHTKIQFVGKTKNLSNVQNFD
jgi:hypothetical protein